MNSKANDSGAEILATPATDTEGLSVPRHVAIIMDGNGRWAQGRGLAVPRYEIIERSGPQHQLHFVVEARIDGFDPARGKGRTRREAEQDAATAVLMRQGLWPEVGNA